MIVDLDSITIRRAKVSDAPGIARVHVESWQSAYAGQIPDRVLVKMSIPDKAAEWNRIISAGGSQFTLVAEDSAYYGIVGFANAGPARCKIPDEGEVYTLYLLPDWQGIGLGRRLLAATFSELLDRGFSVAVVWVLATNPSRFFYHAMGGDQVLARRQRLWGRELTEVAYAWPDLSFAVADELQGRRY